MTSKSSKISKKEPNTKTVCVEAIGSDVSMAAIASLLDTNREALAADFHKTITALEAKIDHLRTTVTDHIQKIAGLESNTNLMDEHVLTLETTCASLADSNAKLMTKITDLESRSHHNNIRIVG
ncbi:hypothetical protein LDENG_00249030 [Lucifuga dentata]|nr:hypothetical protein LDENG_00249030 [Lucifuga dentata]